MKTKNAAIMTRVKQIKLSLEKGDKDLFVIGESVRSCAVDGDASEKMHRDFPQHFAGRYDWRIKAQDLAADLRFLLP